MRTAALACVLTFMLACAAAPQSVTLVDKPVTVTVSVPAGARHAENIVLQLQQVFTPKSASATWNMFVELPTADAATSVELPNFAGYVTTLPNPSAPTNPPKGMTLQVPEPAATIVRRLAQVRLTFVPAAKFADGGVRIGSIRLEPLR